MEFFRIPRNYWRSRRFLSQLQWKKKYCSFSGLCSYFRPFARNFPLILSPLKQLLRGAKDLLSWCPACDDAFPNLRHLLKAPPILRYLGPQVHTYTSSIGLSAVLSQRLLDHTEHVGAYASRMLTKAEGDYKRYGKWGLCHRQGTWKVSPLSIWTLFWHSDRLVYAVFSNVWTLPNFLKARRLRTSIDDL